MSRPDPMSPSIYFPLALFVLFGGLHYELLFLGYALYFGLFTLGVALRSKTIYIVFVCVLTLNIGGCYMVFLDR